MEEDETNDGVPFTPYATTLAALATPGEEGATCVRVPMVDVGVPSREAMTSALDHIDAALAADRPVYVHCFGGIGRTGMVVGCWLLRHGLAAAGDVVDVLARLRRKDKERVSRRSPETDAQVAFLRAWGRA